MSTHLGKPAVVVGAGMAGLTAARALADFFERVIVLENASYMHWAGRMCLDTVLTQLRHGTYP